MEEPAGLYPDLTVRKAKSEKERERDHAITETVNRVVDELKRSGDLEIDPFVMEAARRIFERNEWESGPTQGVAGELAADPAD